MDPIQRLSKPLSRNISQGKNLADVPVAWKLRDAKNYLQRDGDKVPLNSMHLYDHEAGMAQDAGLVLGNTHSDGRAMVGDLKGILPEWSRVKPAPRTAGIMSPQSRLDAEAVQELRWISMAQQSQLGALAMPPPPQVTKPGIEAGPRWYTGDPGVPPIAPTAPPQFEDLRATQTPMPADADAGVTAMVQRDPQAAQQVLGHHSWASLPKPAAGPGNRLGSSAFGAPSLPPRSAN